MVKQCLNEFQKACKFTLAAQDKEDAVIAAIAASDAPVSTDLYQAYSSNLRMAIDAVFADGRNADLADLFQANVSRFAAYKSWHATAQVRDALAENGGDADSARRVLHRFNRWQAAEYNTAVSRSRTAKQWARWDNDDDRRLFPNIIWLPSMSATPRELHMRFWNCVWAKGDPFWNTNQPGNLWNCKCDWEQTDEPVTKGNPEATIKHDGLEGNPAKTGEIFTDNCSYVKKANDHSDVHSFYRDIMMEVAKTTDKRVSASINGQQRDVTVNKIGIRESSRHDFGSPDYWLRNELLERIGDYLPKAHYLGTETIDLSHNTGKALKLKEKMRCAHKSRLDIGNKSFLITIFEYRETGELLLYIMSPL